MSARTGASPALPVGEDGFSSPARSERTAAILGLALGAALVVCFVTGVLSHLSQDPPGWFTWPARPAGLYRLTQGVHVVTGLATIPLLLAKLWAVYPKLFAWPPFTSVAQTVERISLLPLIGASLLLVVTGLGNINVWRPWEFSFRTGHYAAAWIALGGLVVHVGAKWATTRRALRHRTGDARVDDPDGTSRGLDRRGFLVAVCAATGVVVATTAGQTLAPLRRLALLAPRRPDVGPQGFPVNRTAASVDLEQVDVDSWRLVIDGSGVPEPLVLTYADLVAMPRREARLPIACVEGWSVTKTWRGVPLRDLLARAGARDGAEARVHALHRSARQRTSPLNPAQTRDPDTLLALEVEGEPLHADHGFPARLIGPNRPGVHQTKWVGRIEVL